ncbi:hypothetical protein [Pseudomonas tohonis]|uniref:hypothetical protein n=1 Tax=Pseudomonas tohonis TaxID=2725477 RepID=UPI001F3DDCE7|nr:hypothetical protein [Pseudomonas tohonis]
MEIIRKIANFFLKAEKEDILEVIDDVEEFIPNPNTDMKLNIFGADKIQGMFLDVAFCYVTEDIFIIYRAKATQCKTEKNLDDEDMKMLFFQRNEIDKIIKREREAFPVFAALNFFEPIKKIVKHIINKDLMIASHKDSMKVIWLEQNATNLSKVNAHLLLIKKKMMDEIESKGLADRPDDGLMGFADNTSGTTGIQPKDPKEPIEFEPDRKPTLNFK